MNALFARSKTAGLLIPFLLLAACQTGTVNEGSLAAISGEHRQQFFRTCYISTLKRYTDKSLVVDRSRVYRSCSNMARSRYPR